MKNVNTRPGLRANPAHGLGPNAVPRPSHGQARKALAMRLQPQPRGSNSSLMAPLLPRGSNPSSNAQILAQHRSSAPSGPLPLSPTHLTFTNLGATGTADHLTLLRLFLLSKMVYLPFFRKLFLRA